MAAGPAGGPPEVAAWDLPTRLFHWTLVVLLISSWVSFRYAAALGDYTFKWHRWNGYAILVLIVFRVLWGFAGSSTSRFVSFVRSPWVAFGYGLDLLRGRDRHFLGHNPLGSWMILALLAVVAGQATLGLFTVEHNDITAGPLYRLVSEPTWQLLSKWHVWMLYWVILPLVAVHVTANVLYGVVKRDPLIQAMVSGVKPAADYEDERQARLVARPMLRALACLVLASVIVFGGIWAVGGRL
jgi:cytochrome b